ncbi:desmocollin 2-like protein [Trichomycterus rosablanca]|uniref:desmocollin 2-like protein n=1 Tax=Trichomycterus rosablanca TaxID=2290929 RepID=UPI002F3559CC
MCKQQHSFTIISDKEDEGKPLLYELKGHGADKEPYNVFIVNPKTGVITLAHPLDREEISEYNLIGIARYNNGTLAEKKIQIKIVVEDQNDNPPTFKRFRGSVPECRPTGTQVMKITADDADQSGTLNAQIAYSIVKQLPEGSKPMFGIDKHSGVIYVKERSLDRETLDHYTLIVQGVDLAGAPEGNTGTGTVEIAVTDINDNVPTLEKDEYSASVDEDTVDVVVMRIKALDVDLKNSDNWLAVFDIISGNEDEMFTIETDPKTNEGIFKLVKPLDYEKQKVVNLEVMARNENPSVKTAPVWNKASVEITVENEDEGPEFSPAILRLNVKENVPNGTTIGTYSAIDPDTSSSKGIKYYKITDPGSWINVMESTGELKTAKTIDRESPLVYNNTYNITVKAVDETRKTGTGTVFILIEDVNDNKPKIVSLEKVLCFNDNAWGSTLIEAVDYDQPPFSGPFTFAVGKEAEGTWKLKRATDTSAVLEQTVDLANNIYKVPVQVQDLQGSGEVQTVTVRVCGCDRNGECKAQSVSSKLGAGGILALLLAPLLLLLLCLLCVFACTTKREKMAFALDDADGSLFKSNSEAPGEEAKAPFIIPASGLDTMDSLKGGYLEHQNSISMGGGGGGGGIGGFEQHTIQRDSMYQTNMQSHMINTLNSGQYGTGVYGGTINKFTSDMSTFDRWTTTGMHLQERMINLHQKPRERYADDILKPYGVEGTGSPAGSVGCCSILEEQNTLDFLDSLGPKFKTLADVCTSKMDGNRL